ncbi:MAG: NAD(P)-dependent glycerol-3-phosphate dehydrogenase [Acidisphaera sp.]|nr:NAD(P)-dependent glycerol-3-phosphate dehydrogenase [Acidisphaera sp.]MBV9812638.1 NAD(P)-dependent glycerol-3-phosphate dehydrogenase [Acetobacteraceae bacterium]
MSRVQVVGAGAWGTALAIQAARAGNVVRLCARDPERAAAIVSARENPRLPGVRLPDGIAVSHGPEPSELTLLAVPTQQLRAASARLPGAGVLVCGAKGVEAGSNALPLEILAETRPGEPAAVLTGPNFAGEVARGLPAGATVAARQREVRERVTLALATPAFRLYGNDDPVGAQVGGAAKNVIGIAAGAVIGAGWGENARAGLVTRGLAELMRLARALGGRAETVAGLSGLGDLMLTCAGPTSRNYDFGLALGRGASVADALAARAGVVEGVATAQALVARARASGIELPICEVVAALLAGAITLTGAMTALLSRPLRDE